MYFKASYDNMTKAITGIIIVCYIIILWTFTQTLQNTPVPVSIIVAIFLATLVFSYGFSVTHYTVDQSFLTIHRPFGKKQIRKSDVNTITVINRKSLQWSWRVFGNGGFFGYYGSFFNKQFGNMTWFMTRRDKPVLITLKNGKKIVVSPDNGEAFVSAFED